MHIGNEHVHYAWDNAIAPVAEIASGQQIELETVNASGGQLRRDSTAGDVAALDLARVNPVTGPIAVAGAEPGSALAVHVLELDVDTWGWTACIPGFGLLADDFPEPHLAISDVGSREVALPFGPRIPTLPMIGTLGVALPERGAHPLVPPSRHGGNMDIRHLTAGATVVLPVGVEGALLSVGDAHAAMGDGEVCGTGVEASARVLLRVDVLDRPAPAAPLLRTATTGREQAPAFATTGIGPDLMAATRDATRAMIDEVCRHTDLAPVEAYLLASVAGDLKISEVVDAPNWVVSFHLATSLLEF